VSDAEVRAAIHAAVEARLPGATVAVAGGAGHYTIDVTAAAFAGLATLERHRLVLGAVAPLMKGDDAPVHAVDKLTTR
jgi:stress-induced morphogen